MQSSPGVAPPVAAVPARALRFVSFRSWGGRGVARAAPQEQPPEAARRAGGSPEPAEAASGGKFGQIK